MGVEIQTFSDIKALAQNLRDKLNEKKYCLIYAYNGTGKTRLSMAFKDLGKVEDERDTLYFNAYTEDLFHWDNDLENDERRVLRMNTASRFFAGLAELEMESRIRRFLHRYVDFDFEIDYKEGTVTFSRTITDGDSQYTVDHIKISRGEENIFIWCFFLAVAQLSIDEQEAYQWVKYIYIDDPISSLDDNNAIAVAAHLAKLLKGQERIKTVISSHHTLFFNVICNELLSGRQRPQYFLSQNSQTKEYTLRYTGATPQFYHVAMLKELYEVANSGEIYTYHFTILRTILEKTAAFHGFKNFSECIKQNPDDEDGVLHARLVNLLSHGEYSLYEPVEMLPENKEYFRQILHDFMSNYRFNPELFPENQEQGSEK